MKLNAAFFFLIAIISVASAPQVSALVGDVNNDNTVNSLDLLAVQANLNKLIGFNPLADINGDSIVNLYDLVLVAQHWGETYIVTPPTIVSSAPNGILPAGTTNTTINVTTNINALCHYSNTSNITYGNGTAFNITGTTTHSTLITGLQNNTNYHYYVRCANATNTNITDTTDYAINFSINATPPVIGSICEANIGSHCYYIAPNGDDASPGTYAAPFKTFKPAIVLASPGDFIYARGGTYTVANNMAGTGNWGNPYPPDPYYMMYIADYQGVWQPKYTVNNGTAGHPITVRNYPGETPKFTGITNDTQGASSIVIYKSYWTIEGFDIDGGSIGTNGGGGFGLENHDIIIQNNNIHDFVAWGVPPGCNCGEANVGMIRIDRGSYSGAYNIFIRNNTFARTVVAPGIPYNSTNWTGSPHYAALTVLSAQTYEGYSHGGTGYIEFSNNDVSAGSQAFFFKNPMYGPIDVHDNVFHGGLGMGTAANVHVYHNIVYDGGFYAVGNYQADPTVPPNPLMRYIDGYYYVIENNTFVNANSIMQTAGGARHNITHNIFFGLNTSVIGAMWDTGGGYITVGSGAIDPVPTNQSILQNITDNNNCFIAANPNFIFVSRYWVNGTPLEFYNYSRGKTAFNFDANSVEIIQSDPTKIFVNPAAHDYHLIDPSVCPGMGYYGTAGTAVSNITLTTRVDGGNRMSPNQSQYLQISILNGTMPVHGVVTFTTSDPRVATTSLDTDQVGKITGVNPGMVNITATYLGASATAQFEVPTTIFSTVNDSEPTYNSSQQVLMINDSFDNYSNYSALTGAGWYAGPNLFTGVDHGSGPDTNVNPLGNTQLIADGHIGQAIRLAYDGVSSGVPGQESHAWIRINGFDTVGGMPGHAIYISYYARITPGTNYSLDYGPNASIVKIKWLELWNDFGRAQFHTSYQSCGRSDPTNKYGVGGTNWGFYGTSGTVSGCGAGQIRPPFAYQGAGAWHRITHKYMSQSAAGAHDGIGQMWYDGTLVVSVSNKYCGLAVPGGAPIGFVNPPHWCEAEDLDQMYVQQPVQFMEFGGPGAPIWPFSVDYDDFQMWRD